MFHCGDDDGRLVRLTEAIRYSTDTSEAYSNMCWPHFVPLWELIAAARFALEVQRQV